MFNFHAVISIYQNMMLIVVHRSETTTSNKISGDSDMLSHLISLGFHAEQKAGNVMES